jgi:hypothetical protein
MWRGRFWRWMGLGLERLCKFGILYVDKWLVEDLERDLLVVKDDEIFAKMML